VVVLWPRIVPQEATGNSADLAGAVQNHVRRLAEQALPGYTIDVRPSPERTCPEAGCLGVSVAVLFMREENGCALAAVVSGPGRTSGRLIPWVGELTLESTTVAFRDPPENHVLVRDFMPCGDLLGHLNDGDARIVEAIKEAAR
jgi:hypothetical protein